MKLPNVAVHIPCPACGMLLHALDDVYKPDAKEYRFSCVNSCCKEKRSIYVTLPTVDVRLADGD